METGKEKGQLGGPRRLAGPQSQPWLGKLTGYLGERDRAGWAALPPLLPWNAVFIYGALFLWGNHFCQGWGSWQDISKEISLCPSQLELLGTKGGSGRHSGRRGGSEPAGGVGDI